jgi:hypothetical protein
LPTAIAGVGGFSDPHFMIFMRWPRIPRNAGWSFPVFFQQGTRPSYHTSLSYYSPWRGVIPRSLH